MALERQLRRLRAYALVTYPFACVPFLFPYFVGHGIDEAQYGVVLTAYYLTMFVAELPTGMLADRFGSRVMLVLGPLLLAAGFGTLLLWPTFPGFVTAEVLLGLGHAVLSGPPTVALYESLKAAGAPGRYLAEEGRVHALRLYGTGGSFLLGGLLVRYGNADGAAYPLAIIATSMLNLLAALIALGVRPPRRTSTKKHRSPFLSSARAELRKPAVIWLFAYWVVLFTLLRFPFHNYQPYLLLAGRAEPLLTNAVLVGILFAGLNLFAAPISSRVPALVHSFGRRPLFWAMPMILCASIAVMATTDFSARAACWTGVAMFFVQQVPFAMHWPLLHEFVNHRIGSHARTTVLSSLSLGARLCYALLNAGLFALQAQHGLGQALLITAVGGLLLATVVLWLRPRGLLRGD